MGAGIHRWRLLNNVRFYRQVRFVLKGLLFFVALFLLLSRLYNFGAPSTSTYNIYLFGLPINMCVFVCVCGNSTN